MAGSDGLTWGVSSATVNVGETITVPIVSGMAPTTSGVTAAFNGLATAVVGGSEVEITGVAPGTVTVPADTNVGNMVRTVNAFTLTVVDAEEKFLDKNGLNYYDSLIADEMSGKQDKLTAGTGISITGNTISATGGGVADSVAWGHITGSMSDQTDLTTALNAKANTADLATVATSGDYDDLADKPTIGNATLTIQKNGTSAGTFTANATSNKTINITVPTTAADVSALPASTKYGASIAVSINTTDYKVTTTLKDQDGNTLGTAQVIDLPLESVVVNGSYDDTNKKIVLTLQNGNTIDIPVGDLVAGLQSEITSTNKLASDLVDDTNQTHKFVTAAQITKLNGIAAGAEVNQNAFSNVKVGSTTVAADAKTDTLELVAGSNVTLTPDATNDKVTIAATDTTYGNATTSAAGLMSAADKTKLNGIAAGAEANVQSDWSVTDSSSDAFIKNKPTLATVATSGSYNDLSNKPTIPAAQVQSDWAQATTTAVDYIKNKPTKVSDFTNDAGYITSYTDTQVTQTRVDPSAITTFYPVASTSSSTNTGDVKKFGAVKINYVNDDGGRAELELGQNSYNDPVYGELTLWDIGPSSQHKTTLRRALDATNQTFYFPYNADSTSGTLVANGAINAGTGSATNPVYADKDGILHATTYALNKTVPSNAVFTDTTYSDATTSASGLMSASDKTKLNGIAAGAEVNVQANWAQTTTTADDYIKNKPTLATVATSGSYNDLSNKPTIPTVNNATLTIQKNGSTVKTFTANASSNVTANITVPTKTSDLTNDSDFATKAYIQSRDENLVTNGSGLLGDNYNFSMLTFDPVNAYGTPGSFKTTARNSVLYNDEYIPVDITSSYKMSFDVKTTNGSARFYNAIQSYDVDKRAILFKNVNWVANTTTTLSQALNTGDTVIHLTSAANWNTTTTFSYQKGIIVWNYENSYGYKYPVETYSQNVYPSLYSNNSAVNKTNNTITLASGWAGPNLPAGTSVSQCTDGSTYIYIGDLNYTVPANTWTHKEGILSPSLYRAGTAYIRIGWLANRDITGNISTWFNNVKFYEYTTPPTVNNGQLTIQKNGSNVATFTANQSGNSTANITVPTKTSDLTNDSGFIDSVAWGDVTGKPTFATVATSGSYNDLSNKPTIPTVGNATLTIQKNGTNVQTFTANATSNKTANITVPTKTSDLTNDSNFVASTALATVATSGSYNDLSNKPTIPTVNNATLTIQKNGTTVKTFTANASSNVTANITVPTALSDLSGTVSSSQIAGGAVTDDKIDWTSFGSSEWPIINTNTSNNNVNTTQFYNQYEYTVPVNGVYMVMFSQRLTNGANNYDFTVRITYDNTQVQAVAAGGSTWVNWIPGNVFAFIEAKAGKIIRCQSSGGGTGSHTTQNGRVSIMRIR